MNQLLFCPKPVHWSTRVLKSNFIFSHLCYDLLISYDTSLYSFWEPSLPFLSLSLFGRDTSETDNDYSQICKYAKVLCERAIVASELSSAWITCTYHRWHYRFHFFFKYFKQNGFFWKILKKCLSKSHFFPKLLWTHQTFRIYCEVLNTLGSQGIRLTFNLYKKATLLLLIFMSKIQVIILLWS